MFRRAAVTTLNTGANKLWAGTVTINPKAKTGPHHHGDLESVIYVVLTALLPQSCRFQPGWIAVPASRFLCEHLHQNVFFWA
jgi:hypothetical protein